jgi:hypothetical protein
LETPEVFELCPRLFILFIEKAMEFLDTIGDCFELPEGPPDSTLLPEPGLFSLLLNGGPDPPDLEVDDLYLPVRMGTLLPLS